MNDTIVRVALDHPLPTLFDYAWRLPGDPVPGQLVALQFGKRELVGLVWEISATTEVPAARLRPVQAALTSCDPLDAPWRALIAFAAHYYQRSVGEVALPALPQALRDPRRWPRLFPVDPIFRAAPERPDALRDAVPARATALRKLAAALDAPQGCRLSEGRRLHPKARDILADWVEKGWIEEMSEPLVAGLAPATLTLAAEPSSAATRSPMSTTAPTLSPSSAVPAPAFALTDEQRAAVDAITGARAYEAFLLFGITGSGKTEVYLRALASCLARAPDAQALVLVPEINLTPQFEASFRQRFPELADDAIVTLHSGLAEGERARAWLAAHRAQARIVLGTRLAVLASMPRLALIVVDEEHDPAYKQQEGLRYSARDLAVWRAKQLEIPVVLGSATPSLESWAQAQQRRYRRLDLTRRAVTDAALPAIRLIDLDADRQQGRGAVDGLSPSLVAALRSRLEQGQQSLIFLNRRGFAPVLGCDACAWVAGCHRCTAYMVLHKPERALRCHHCGWQAPIPRACPSCGNLDLAPLGRGTQRIEETLGAALPGARILRIDADSTRLKGSAQALFSDVHAGEVDVLVGTQMIAKGHDFKNVTLVGVLNADTALFSHDFRAGERLFAQLMQVGGRAGRTAQPGEVLIQTRYPTHPLFGALVRHDYPGFAGAALAERRDARLPPFVFQALLRAEGRTLEAALAFLNAGAAALDGLPGIEQVTRYEAVPLTVVKVMHVHRAQLLLESGSRAALHGALRAWQPHLRALKGVLRWAIEVDPLEI